MKDFDGIEREWRYSTFHEGFVLDPGWEYETAKTKVANVRDWPNMREVALVSLGDGKWTIKAKAICVLGWWLGGTA